MRYALLVCFGLFLGMILASEIGRRIGRRQLAREPTAKVVGTGVTEGSVFALLGLLIAFAFSGAASRFDHRRELIVDETNAIGTAYLRVDLLLPEDQRPMRDQFRRYVEARIEVYRRLPDLDAARAELVRAKAIQDEIWQLAVPASARAPVAAPTHMLLLNALNVMFDISNTRTLSAEIHPPFTIYVMLAVLLVVSSVFAGYSMAPNKARSWFHIIGHALALSTALYVTVDIEYPRLGYIRVDAFDHALVELRQALK